MTAKPNTSTSRHSKRCACSMCKPQNITPPSPGSPSPTFYGADGVTPLIFWDDVLSQMGISGPDLIAMLRTGQFPRPGKLPPTHPSGRPIAWLQTDIDKARRRRH